MKATTKPMLRKFRLTAVATETYPGGGKSIRKAKATFFAVDEADVLKQAKEYLTNPEGLPVEYKIEPFTFWFVCETKDVPQLKWWEELAIDAAKLECEDHGDYNKSLEDVAQSIEDGWSEWIARDGEPSPKAGNVDFHVNDDDTKLVIRSKRILAVVTMKQPTL